MVSFHEWVTVVDNEFQETTKISDAVCEKDFVSTYTESVYSETHEVKKEKPSVTKLQIPESSYTENLPPRDKGVAAYTVLFAATVVSSFQAGFYLSFGVFRDYYVHHSEFESTSNAAWIGVLSSGLPFLGAPLLTYCCLHLRIARIHYVWVGWLVCVISLVSAAFCKSISALIVTQGLLYGIGVALGDNPLLIIVNTYWRRRRGFAYGLAFGAADLLGVAWSFLASYLLHHVGQRDTLLICAAIIFVASGGCICLLKERGATSVLRRASITSIDSQYRVTTTPREDAPMSTIATNFKLARRNTPPVTKRYFRRPLFYLLSTANALHSLAFYLPLIYLPSFATAVGYTATHSSLLLALINLSQIGGELLFGFASDYLPPLLLMVSSSGIACVTSLTLWGLPDPTLGRLIAYALLYGWSASGFIALWARMGILFGEKDAPMVFSCMCAGRGVAVLVSGPVSEMLVGNGNAKLGAFGVRRFAGLVAFVGACLGGSALLGVSLINARDLKRQKDWLCKVLRRKGESQDEADGSEVGKDTEP